MRLPLVFAAIVSSAPVLAAETAWQELAPDTRVRLIASERLDPAGRTLVALELDMPAGTKTYWRVPGETGIPLELDFTGTDGLRASRVIWPFPRIEVVAGYTDFVHAGHVVIPIELEFGAVPAAGVELSALMGICSDICVPATAAFSLPLDFSTPDAGQAIRIEQALALAPVAWDGGDPPVRAVRFDAATETLAVSVDGARLDAETLIVDASDAGYVFGAPQKSPETGLVSFALLGSGSGGAAALAGRTIRLVFMTGDGPYEVSRRVDVSTGD